MVCKGNLLADQPAIEAASGTGFQAFLALELPFPPDSAKEEDEWAAHEGGIEENGR